MDHGLLKQSKSVCYCEWQAFKASRYGQRRNPGECPLFFTLHINDVPSTYEGCIVKLFVDDVKAYKHIRSANDCVCEVVFRVIGKMLLPSNRLL